MAEKKPVMVPAAAAREQVEGQDRGQGDRYQEAAQYRDDVGDAQRREQSAFEAGHRKQRHENENDDDRRVKDARAALLARFGDDVENRARIGPGAVFAQSAQDVLYIHHGVVDEFADRDGKATQRHRIDRQPQRFEYDEGDEKGQGNRRERNEGRPHVHQKNHENQRHDDRRLDQRPLQAADRRFDEGGLAELNVRRRDTGRQRLLDDRKGGFDLVGQRHRIGAGLFLDREDHRRLAAISGVAALHACGEIDAGDLAQQHRLILAIGDHGVAQIFQAPGQPDVADQVFTALLVDEPAAGVDAEARNGALDLVVSDVEKVHRDGVRHDAILANFAADRDDLRNARNCQKLGRNTKS